MSLTNVTMYTIRNIKLAVLEKYLITFSKTEINWRSTKITEIDNVIPVIAISDCNIIRDIFKILSYKCEESESLWLKRKSDHWYKSNINAFQMKNIAKMLLANAILE